MRPRPSSPPPSSRDSTSPWRRPARRPLLAALAAASVVLGLATAGAVAATASTAPGARRASGTGLSWHSCATHFRCATLQVPISYADPGKGSLGLAVVELASTGDPSTAGDLVMNPGGPGASGVQFLEQSSSIFPAALRKNFNLVSFDPRGIGQSDPVHCLTAAEERAWLGYNPDPRTTAQINADVAQAKSLVNDCLSRTSHLLLANVGTASTARDLDRLRAALGQAKLDYLGFSYGTFLAEVYAEDFPTRVGHLVLDGVVDPALSPELSAREQALGFESDLNAFFSWCPTNATCAKELPGGAKASWQRLVAQLSSGQTLTALLKPAFGGTQHVDLGFAETGAAEALYSQSFWPYLAQAIALGLRGDGSLFAALALSYAEVNQNGTFSNLTDANIAINCVDSVSPHRLSAFQRLAGELAKVAPDFGPEESWGGLPCAYWPFAVTGPTGAVHAPGTPTVLIVGSTNDPATPYAWAKAVASQFPKAVLLTRQGNGHTGYDSSACVRGYVDAFVQSGTLPPKGTICPSNG